MLSRVVIAGASAAGLTAAETLRRRGYDGELTLIGDEQPHPPDCRPPLSKHDGGINGVYELPVTWVTTTNR